MDTNILDIFTTTIYILIIFIGQNILHVHAIFMYSKYIHWTCIYDKYIWTINTSGAQRRYKTAANDNVAILAIILSASIVYYFIISILLYHILANIVYYYIIFILLAKIVNYYVISILL